MMTNTQMLLKTGRKRKNKKISFLIAAHNEEKIISKVLANLLVLPYDNYEVIIGLDGCTDMTERIVNFFEKGSNKFKHFNLNLRQGKPAVINSIIKHATGDIVIIHDADWIFKVKNREQLESLINIFNDPSVGGISERNALEFEENSLKSGNIGFKMVAYSSQLWIKYQQERFSKNGILIEPTMFLTNIFRRELFKPNTSLGDDFERTKDVMETHIIRLAPEDSPRFIPAYNEISIRDLFRLKIRTAIAREQIKNKILLPKNYYPLAIWYLLTNSWRHGLKAGLLVSSWTVLTILATIIGKFKSKNTSTKEGWSMRAKR